MVHWPTFCGKYNQNGGDQNRWLEHALLFACTNIYILPANPLHKFIYIYTVVLEYIYIQTIVSSTQQIRCAASLFTADGDGVVAVGGWWGRSESEVRKGYSRRGWGKRRLLCVYMYIYICLSSMFKPASFGSFMISADFKKGRTAPKLNIIERPTTHKTHNTIPHTLLEQTRPMMTVTALRTLYIHVIGLPIWIQWCIIIIIKHICQTHSSLIVYL